MGPGLHQFFRPVPLIDSGTWKAIFQSRCHALLHMKRSIGNKETTSLWYDDWLKEGSTLALKELQSPSLLSAKWKVSDIIKAGTWAFSEPGLQGIWHFITHRIQQRPDKWVWTSTAQEICTFASAWHAVSEVAPAFRFCLAT